MATIKKIKKYQIGGKLPPNPSKRTDMPMPAPSAPVSSGRKADDYFKSRTSTTKQTGYKVPVPKVSKSYKNGGSFPDLNKDGKITKADILKGRGVIAKKGMKVKKAQYGASMKMVKSDAGNTGMSPKIKLPIKATTPTPYIPSGVTKTKKVGNLAMKTGGKTSKNK